MEHKALQVPLGLKVFQALPDQLAHKVLMDHPDLQDQRVHKELQVLQAQLVL